MKTFDETYIEYKKRVMDPISSSFCAAKWYNATIWLGHGATTSCHLPPAHAIPLEELEKNPKALHNTLHKKVMRSLMLKGKRPQECEYCWKIEDIKRENVSDRVFKTVIYTDEEIKAAARIPAQEDVGLKTLEIAFERTCNFACSYCNAGFSTTWGKDIKNNGAYQNLVSDGAGAYQHDGSWAQPYKLGEVNPYVEAFWKWWPELSQSLQELRITGGEPLMSNDVWKLFEYFKEKGSGDLCFSINSNLGSRDELIEKLIEKSHYVKNFQLYTSCEAMEAQAEYIRDGLNFEQYVQNVHKILKRANIKSLNMMMTINSLSLFSLTDFLDLMLQWKDQYGWYYPVWSVNILRFPSFMSPAALPDHIKEERRKNLENWLIKNQDHPKMHEMERDGLKRLIDYLDVVKTAHQKTSQTETLWKDFKSFYKQYDQRRGKNILKAFPTLGEWLEKIPDTHLAHKQKLVEGNATKGFHDPDAIKNIAMHEGLL